MENNHNPCEGEMNLFTEILWAVFVIALFGFAALCLLQELLLEGC